MADSTIYLDNNATTALLPEVADAMRDAWVSVGANPASQHGPGRVARRLIEAARNETIQLLGGVATGSDPDRLVFTSGGTESNALAIRGLLAAGQRPRLVVSAIEHASVARTADALESEGIAVDRLPVTDRGLVEIAALEELFASHGDSIGLVSVMGANNETGVLQPIKQIAELCREAGVPMHTDAAQVAGKHPTGFRANGLAALSFAPHKFHGPVGIGGLLLAPWARPEPSRVGGFQQEGLRPGTEPVGLAIGAARALRIASTEQDEARSRLAALRARFERAICETWPGAVVIGESSPRLEHAACVAFPGADRQALVMAYDLAGVACSTGSACASGSSEPSATLTAMGLPDPVIRSAVRFSLSRLTTESEIDAALERIGAVHARVR